MKTQRFRNFVASIALVGMACGGWIVASTRPFTQEAVERTAPAEAAAPGAIKQVQRGILTFDRGEHQATARLAEPVNVDKCVVVLSDVIVRGERDSGNPRSAAIVAEFTETRLTVWTEEQHTRRAVSFQVIEYR